MAFFSLVFPLITHIYLFDVTFCSSARKSIYLESQHEEALGRLHQLEGRTHQRPQIVEDVVTQSPIFTQPIKDVHVAESQAAHFEARLIPVGDDRLKVEWLRNGVPIQACT